MYDRYRRFPELLPHYLLDVYKRQDYDYYLEKKEELTEKYAPVQETLSDLSAADAEESSSNKLTWQQQKEEQARRRKQENELKKTEARIEELENRDKEIDETLVLPDVCTNVGRCAELSREKEAILAELEELYEKWETLAWEFPILFFIRKVVYLY